MEDEEYNERNCQQENPDIKKGTYPMLHGSMLSK